MTFSWTISPRVSLYSLFLCALGFQNRRVLRFRGRRRRSQATGRAGVTSEEETLTTRCRPRARRDGSERRRPFTHLFPPSSDTLLPNCVVLPPYTPCLARFCTSRPQRTAYPPAGHRPGREARARESLPKRDSTRSLTRRCGSARAAKDAGVLIRARRDGPRRSFCRALRRAAGLKSRVPNANQGGLGSRPGAPGGEPVRSCGISKGTLLVKIGRRSGENWSLR